MIPTPFPPSVHRLQEEATRLRDTLKAKSRRADKADELESDLAKSEVSVDDVLHVHGGDNRGLCCHVVLGGATSRKLGTLTGSRGRMVSAPPNGG